MGLPDIKEGAGQNCQRTVYCCPCYCANHTCAVLCGDLFNRGCVPCPPCQFRNKQHKQCLGCLPCPAEFTNPCLPDYSCANLAPGDNEMHDGIPCGKPWAYACALAIGCFPCALIHCWKGWRGVGDSKDDMSLQCCPEGTCTCACLRCTLKIRGEVGCGCDNLEYGKISSMQGYAYKNGYKTQVHYVG